MLKKTLIITIILLISIQFISVDKTNPPVDESISLKAPNEVMSILKKGCYDCHSNETKWPYYSDIAPVSFFVASHVNKGRKAMNFSVWNKIDSKIKHKRLKRAVITVNNGIMALPSYISAHDEAKLSKGEKEIITTWFKKQL
ncbi:MAG: heme-binding domain-containing protein [Sulfurimonas sp.]|nr:heme-binding domain-containing protein [Sulfurimonas sp.]